MKTYKLFRMREGRLYPLFVETGREMKMGIWLEAGIGDADIDEAYADFENAEKKREIHEFAEAEGINEETLTTQVAEYEFSGIMDEGHIRDSIEQPMGLLKKKSLVRRIVDFIMNHVAKYQ